MADAATKEHAHELIDRIDPAQVAQAVAFLEKLLDPLANAPFEDEEISEEEKIAVARAKSEPGPVTSMEDFLAEFGLTVEELRDLKLPPLDEHAG